MYKYFSNSSMKLFIQILIFLFIFPLLILGDEYVIISNKNMQALTKEQIKTIYLKKSMLVNGVNVIPVNLEFNDIIREKFNQEILDMNTSELKEYWANQHYIGNKPPISMKSQESIKAFVKNVDGSIGYISINNKTDDEKIIYRWGAIPEKIYHKQYKIAKKVTIASKVQIASKAQATPLPIYTEEIYDDQYKFGNGIKLASLPVYIGGYFSVDYRNMNGENRYRIDDLAVLSYGNYNKFSYMAELEYKQFYTKTYTNNSSYVVKDTKLHTERLYVNYDYDENYAFKIGKYNSPIGFWNLLPVNVLRDTTSNPIVTNIIFPKFTTGLEASYISFDDAELQLDVMVQHNEDFDDTYNNYKIDEHYGFGITYEKDDYTLKLNLGHFSQLKSKVLGEDEDLNYVLFSAKYDVDKYQFMSEFGVQSSNTKLTTPYAGYIQALYNITDKHSAILRAEKYKDNQANTKDNIAVIGYTYRPLYPVALKSELQLHSHHKEDQLLFSLSVMF